LSARKSARARFFSVLVLLLGIAFETGLFAAAPARAAAATGERRFGIVADIGTRHGVYGQSGGAVGLLAGSGASWVKEEFRWDWVEPSRGRWEWAFMDEAVDAERAKGLEILGLLDYTAGWAVGEGRPVSNTPPPHDLWANYVAQVVGRYKDRVHAWEVWNEPNVPVFWSGTKEQYAALLAVTYDTIKRVDPSATVLGPTISGIDEEWLAALNWDKIDALALHLYTSPAFLNEQSGYSFYGQGLPQMKQTLAKFLRKPIWITEFGFSSQGGADPWHVGDEAAQARFLVQQVAQMLAYPDLPIVRIMPYVFNDHDGFELVRGWSTPKPAYHAYRVAAERLEGATGKGRFSAGSGVFAFRFERDGKQIDLVWSVGGGVATIPSGGDARVIDLFGQERTIGREGDVVRVPVSADPVYVIHDAVDTGPVGNGLFAGPGRGFAETGQSIRGPFLAQWEQKGGLAIYGYPISPEMVEVLEDGKPYLVQYFERARFEFHPENPPTSQVLLGQFGRLLHPLYPPVPDCRCGRYFPETGHNIAGDFKDYWEQHGGLAQFGYPLTDQVVETLEDGKQYRVQWFERARFEFHPENTAPNQILLGQFGRVVYESKAR
jgi:hypothetical protein